MASARALLPLPTSPPSTMRSPRRKPPPRSLSRLENPDGTVSMGSAPSATASTRPSRSDRGEMSAPRGIPQDRARPQRGARKKLSTLSASTCQGGRECRQFGTREVIQVAPRYLAQRANGRGEGSTAPLRLSRELHAADQGGAHRRREGEGAKPALGSRTPCGAANLGQIGDVHLIRGEACGNEAGECHLPRPADGRARGECREVPECKNGRRERVWRECVG